MTKSFDVPKKRSFFEHKKYCNVTSGFRNPSEAAALLQAAKLFSQKPKGFWRLRKASAFLELSSQRSKASLQIGSGFSHAGGAHNRIVEGNYLKKSTPLRNIRY